MRPGAGPQAWQAPLGGSGGPWWLCRAYVCYLPKAPGLTSHREQAPPSPWPPLPQPLPHTACSLPRAPQGLPVAFPGVPHICVVDAVSVRLLIQEVKHVLDGQGEGAAPVHSAEQGLEQVVHELLQGALGEGQGGEDEVKGRGEKGDSGQQAGRPDGALDQPRLGNLSATPA